MDTSYPGKDLSNRFDAIADWAEKLAEQGRRLIAMRSSKAADASLAKYRDDPVGYCTEVLKVVLTEDQARIARAFLEPPFKVKVRAGHNVGKTFLFAALANWWFDTRDPGIVITTAPTERDVVDLLWTEVRLQRSRANLPDVFIGPAAPEMRTSPDHWAKGYTARKGESFQGRHRANMLFLFDEDDGIDSLYFDRTKGMFKAGDGHAWGSIGNPYTTSSASYLEELKSGPDGQPAWRLFTLSALDHPNVKAELRGEKPPVPDAVSLAQIESAIAEKCHPIAADQRKKTDIEWPPGSNQWHRPGPLFEAGVLGRRPTQGTNSVWSDAAFQDACRAGPITPESLVINGLLPEVGCDVAVFGDDWTAMHVRIGPISLYHESANGWGPEQVAGRLKLLCREWAAWANRIRDRNSAPVKPTRIRVKVELDGPGHGVASYGRETVDGDNWNWVGVSASSAAMQAEVFRNVRSELWFTVSGRANAERLDLSRLPPAVLSRLRQQCMAPVYSLNGGGQMEVEPKKDTKKRIGRSPDDVDGMDLAYYEGGQSIAVPHFVDTRDGRDEGRGFDRMANRDRG